MGADQGMGRRRRIDGLEQDAFSRWGRQYLCYINNIPGIKAYAKTKANRRDRRDGKRQARMEGG